MDIQATKLDLMKKIMAVSKESLLEKIDAILQEEMIVGYTTTGEPLTQTLYNRRLEEAERQIASGEFQSQEELEKESENW